jgi:glycosyltransferase involved in cell wall biosynthesis
LEKQTRDLNLEDRATFAGRISNRDLYRYYERCSFLVLPAVYDKKGDIEGLGVVLIEAMSYLKPVIASDAGGITDVVENGVNGLLVPPGDTHALARAIKTLATDDVLRKKMGLQAKQIIDEKFNWNKIVSRLIALYKNRE